MSYEYLLLLTMAFLTQRLRFYNFLHRKQNEQEMQQLKDILNFLPDGIIIQDTRHREPLFYNKALEDMMAAFENPPTSAFSSHSLEKGMFTKYGGSIGESELLESLSLRDITKELE